MKRQRGFTLFEILVVVTIISLLVSFAYVGFNQLVGRRSSEDMESLQYWLQSAADRAQLEGAVYGIKISEQGLLVLTYRQGIWLQVLDQQPWGQEGEYQLSFEIFDINQPSINADGGEEELQPSLVFLPDGSQWPAGRIRVENQSYLGWISANEQGQFLWADE